MAARSLLATATATAAAAAVAAAATVSSACSNSDSIVTTAGQTPEATAAAMRQAATPKQDNWVSLPASAVSVPAGVMAPGGIIRGIDTEGDMARCTITAATPSGEILTAGHCGLAGSARLLPDGTVVGTITKSIDEVPSAGAVLDAAVVSATLPVTAAATRIAERPVAGVMNVEGIRKLPKGTSVCFDGAKSGLKCGPLLSADRQGMEIDADSTGGDSGAPVFLVDGGSQTVTLVGILSGSPKSDSAHMLATYLDPALERLGAQALVDPTAAGTVAGDPRYSESVAPLS
jgi:hypothetical protein